MPDKCQGLEKDLVHFETYLPEAFGRRRRRRGGMYTEPCSHPRVPKKAATTRCPMFAEMSASKEIGTSVEPFEILISLLTSSHPPWYKLTDGQTDGQTNGAVLQNIDSGHVVYKKRCLRGGRRTCCDLARTRRGSDTHFFRLTRLDRTRQCTPVHRSRSRTQSGHCKVIRIPA